jgi:EAL domain-containing protein (putative c-di-GMP-specific phosphodiesterase class I)
MIEYSQPFRLHHFSPITVKLDGRVIGKIHQDKDGFRYYPKGQKTGGEAFPTIAQCKRSLES